MNQVSSVAVPNVVIPTVSKLIRAQTVSSPPRKKTKVSNHFNTLPREERNWRGNGLSRDPSMPPRCRGIAEAPEPPVLLQASSVPPSKWSLLVLLGRIQSPERIGHGRRKGSGSRCVVRLSAGMCSRYQWVSIR